MRAVKTAVAALALCIGISLAPAALACRMLPPIPAPQLGEVLVRIEVTVISADYLIDPSADFDEKKWRAIGKADGPQSPPFADGLIEFFGVERPIFGCVRSSARPEPGGQAVVTFIRSPDGSVRQQLPQH